MQRRREPTAQVRRWQAARVQRSRRAPRPAPSCQRPLARTGRAGAEAPTTRNAAGDDRQVGGGRVGAAEDWPGCERAPRPSRPTPRACRWRPPQGGRRRRSAARRGRGGCACTWLLSALRERLIRRTSVPQGRHRRRRRRRRRCCSCRCCYGCWRRCSPGPPGEAALGWPPPPRATADSWSRSAMQCRSWRAQGARLGQHALAAKPHASARSAGGVKQASAGVSVRGSCFASRASMRARCAHAGRPSARTAVHFSKFRLSLWSGPGLVRGPGTALVRARYRAPVRTPAARFMSFPGSRRPLDVLSPPRGACSSAPGIPMCASYASSDPKRAHVPTGSPLTRVPPTLSSRVVIGLAGQLQTRTTLPAQLAPQAPGLLHVPMLGLPSLTRAVRRVHSHSRGCAAGAR